MLWVSRTKREIQYFSRQLATLLTAGIPLLQALDTIQHSCNKAFIAQLRTDIASGSSLAQAMAKHPQYFNRLEISLITVGESSGNLDSMLMQVAVYKEKMLAVKKKVAAALSYPLLVFLLALIVSLAMLLGVVPQFALLFKQVGANLPPLTKALVYLAELLQVHWGFIILFLMLVVCILLIYAKHSLQFVHYIDRMSLLIPVIGSILTKAIIARFTRTLAITCAAGLPIAQALKLTAGATGNSLYDQAVTGIQFDVSQGNSLHKAMLRSQKFAPMVVQMIAIGEESGALEKMLSKVATLYEDDVATAVDSLSGLLEPIVICILGVLVGGLVLAMYLPLFKMGTAF